MADNLVVNRLAAVRKQLLLADIARSGSLSEVFSAFLDITESTDLISESKRTDDRAVEETLVRIMQHYTGDKSLRIGSFQMLSHAEGGVVHGGFASAGKMGTFFYFTAEGQGLLALYGGGPTTDYCRITTTVLPAGTVPMRRPRGVQ